MSDTSFVATTEGEMRAHDHGYLTALKDARDVWESHSNLEFNDWLNRVIDNPPRSWREAEEETHG